MLTKAAEQAVSTSMVYLFRSLGTVWGVAASSTLIQNVLAQRLPLLLADQPDSEKVRTLAIFAYRYVNYIH